MIIAYSFLILGIIILLLCVSVIVQKEKPGRNFLKFALFGFISTICSAQYIWG